MSAPAALAPAPGDVARLPRGVRLHDDRLRGITVLLAPERAVRLDPIGAAILSELDGRRSLAEIAAILAARHAAPAAQVGADVAAFLGDLVARRMVFLESADPAGGAAPPVPGPAAPDPAEGRVTQAAPAEPDTPARPTPAGGFDIDGTPVRAGLPIAMLAELTHRCPLACPYCSNPVRLTPGTAELSAAEWADAFAQAAALGVLQVHLSGGEPASRRDLAQIAAAARGTGLYVNLITSGMGLTRARLEELDGIVDHIQLSLQGTDPAMADWISGQGGSFQRKMQVAGWIAEIGFPLTLNAVVHRQNLDRLPQMIALAEAMGCRRIEVATVQFHGWAELNRRPLMPTRDQARAAREIVAEARARLHGRMVIDYVPADHHASFPKSCMGGWGSTGLNVTPDGWVLPCHAAQTIPGLDFQNLRDESLARIWHEGAAFNAFRGTAWMAEPCRSCDRREVDFGGCRCQALARAGDARATDPVCVHSPLNAALRAEAEADSTSDDIALVYRRMGREVAT